MGIGGKMKDIAKDFPGSWELFWSYYYKNKKHYPIYQDFDDLFGHFLKFFSSHGIEIGRLYKPDKYNDYNLKYNVIDCTVRGAEYLFDTTEEAVRKAFEIIEERGKK